MSANVGDIYKFEYPKEPRFNCILKVTRVLGRSSDDLVFFDDHSNTKQKHLSDDMKVVK